MTVQDITIDNRIAVPRWAHLIAAAALVAVYVVTLENGVVLAEGASTVHELFHDARHFIGVPCH